MLHEPYGKDIEYIAYTSLWQLEHMYRRPYLKRLKRLDRKLKAAQRKPGAAAPVGRVKPIEDRDTFAKMMAATSGGTVEHWLAEFDRGKAKRAQYDAEMQRARNGE